MGPSLLKKVSRRWGYASLLLGGLLGLASCSAPEVITEDAVTSLQQVGKEVGKERKIGDDIQITPAQEDKVKIRF